MPAKGSGNFGRSPRIEPAAAPTVTSAQNGLTLVGTAVELGGANPLLHNTVIELNAFALDIDQGGSRLFSLDPTNDLYGFGDLDGFGNQVHFLIDNPNSRARINKQLSKYFNLDIGGGLYEIGDIDQQLNGSRLIIDDTNQIISAAIGANSYLSLDRGLNNYQFGDIGVSNNGSIVNVKDASSSIELSAAGANTRLTLAGSGGANAMQVSFFGNNFFALDYANLAFQMGDLNAFNNGTQLLVDDTNQGFAVSSNVGGVPFTGLQLSFAAGVFVLGEPTNAGPGNGNRVAVLDTLNRIRIENAANNAKIIMNNVLGFTGVVAPVNTITVDGGIVTNVA